MKTTLLKRVILLSALALACTAFYAQNSFEIRGKIVKSDRPGENYASVTLLDYNTMEIVANEICNERGEFVIEGISKGNYILSVQKPGFPKPERRFINISDKGTVVQTADLGFKNPTPETAEIM